METGLSSVLKLIIDSQSLNQSSGNPWIAGKNKLFTLLQTVIEYYKKSEIRTGQLCFGTNSYEFKDEGFNAEVMGKIILNQLSGSTPATNEEIARVLKVEQIGRVGTNCIDTESTELESLLAQLCNSDEMSIQAQLLSFIKRQTSLFLIDCSTSRNCPFIELPELSSSKNYEFTAKPNMASLKHPFFLHMKNNPSMNNLLSDNEVESLTQALERVFCQSLTNDCLTRIVSIATCGCRSFLIAFTRSFPDGRIEESFTISEIGLSDIYPIIRQLNMEAATTFVDPNMNILALLLRKLGISPSHVSIKLIYYRMGAFIYEITPYKFGNDGNSIFLPNDPPLKQRFVVKINLKQRIQKEIETIRRIDLVFKSKGSKDIISPVDYVFGVLNSGEFHYCHRKMVLFRERFSSSLVNNNWRNYGTADNSFYSLWTIFGPPRRSPILLTKESSTREANEKSFCDDPLKAEVKNSENKFMVHLPYSSLNVYTEESMKSCWWYYSEFGNSLEECNCILMKAGRPYMGERDPFLYLEGLCNQLEFVYNDCRTAHTDIRPANLLEIDGNLVLIDYDHAISFQTPSACEIKLADIPEGDRKELMCLVLPALKEKEKCNWSILEEVSMLDISIAELRLHTTSPVSSSAWSGSGSGKESGKG